MKVTLLEIMGNDMAVANAAWVSSAKHSSEPTRVADLLKMIVRDGHLSCLEHVVMRFHLENIPLYICQQITRHRLASYNMASARYNFEYKSYYVPNEVSKEIIIDSIDADLYKENCQRNMDFYKYIQQKYSGKEYKRVREVMRGVLPTSTHSNITMTINLRSFWNFYKLRSDSHAQKEIQEVARAMWNELVATQKVHIILSYLLEFQK